MTTAVTLVEPQELEAVSLSYEEIVELATCGKHFALRVIVEPSVAEKILEHNNARNRDLRIRNIKFLTQQIEADRFVYNGESVVWGDDGNLNNGQHRMKSCVEAGKAIEILMVFGIPAERFTTYDQVAPRGGSDVLSIENKQNCGRLAAALRHLDNFELGRLGSHNSKDCAKRVDNAYVLELMRRYPGIELSVAKYCNFPKLTRPSLAAALHYLMSKVDAEAADEFFDIVQHGLGFDRQYEKTLAESAMNLRAWLERNALSSRKQPQHVIANVWIKAWNGYRTGHVLKVLMFKCTEDQLEIL